MVFFRYFRDGEREYLARSWLLDETVVAPGGSGPKRGGTREPWNGHDWYVSFGEYDGGRNWDDARKYGFVSAGGRPWYSKTLRSLSVGARIFAYIPQTGYVGVGTTTGEASPFGDALVTIDGEQQKLSDQPLAGNYHHPPVGDEDTAEYVVPVEWITTRPRELAVLKKGLFANQNSACKLRQRFTLKTLYTEFGLGDAELLSSRCELTAARSYVVGVARCPGYWPLRPEANARCGVPPLLLCLTCVAPSVDVLRRPLVSAAVVTQLVTHPASPELGIWQLDNSTAWIWAC